ncbi:MAG: orotate phosphoribosyltransferase [Dehalococcoidia bacterium]
MVNQVNTEEIFEKAGAILKGHFRLTSGLHSPVYWEKFKVLQSPPHTEKLCRMITDHFRDQKIEAVAAPTTGGIILAFETARQLGVRGIFAEKTGAKERAFKRGFNIEKGERVLIVDDIFTTGGSIRQTMDAVKKLGGNIIGVGVMVDRSTEKVDFGVPLFSCLRAEAVTYSPDNCPLCKEGIPLVKPGGG